VSVIKVKVTVTKIEIQFPLNNFSLLWPIDTKPGACNQCNQNNGTILFSLPFLACRSRQASIVLERYFRFEMSLLSVLYMLIARTEMGTSRVSGDFDIIT